VPKAYDVPNSSHHMPLTTSVPIWRSFQSLASSAEAASVSICCNYSLATLDVTCRDPGVANFAVTEQKHADSWRWAVFNTDGSILNTGCERSREQAHVTAERALDTASTRAPFRINPAIF
jgi:hypothetical protein